MEIKEFDAFVVKEKGDGFSGRVVRKSLSDLPRSDLLIRVCYSSLNYKDALSASGNKGVTKEYPHTPGIDAVGTVVSDMSGKFSENEDVVVTGFDLGMNTDGYCYLLRERCFTRASSFRLSFYSQRCFTHRYRFPELSDDKEGNCLGKTCQRVETG